MDRRCTVHDAALWDMAEAGTGRGSKRKQPYWRLRSSSSPLCSDAAKSVPDLGCMHRFNRRERANLVAAFAGWEELLGAGHEAATGRPSAERASYCT